MKIAKTKSLKTLLQYKIDHLGMTLYDLYTLKHFAKLLASAAKGQLEEKPTEAIVRVIASTKA